MSSSKKDEEKGLPTNTESSSDKPLSGEEEANASESDPPECECNADEAEISQTQDFPCQECDAVFLSRERFCNHSVFHSGKEEDIEDLLAFRASGRATKMRGKRVPRTNDGLKTLMERLGLISSPVADSSADGGSVAEEAKTEPGESRTSLQNTPAFQDWSHTSRTDGDAKTVSGDPRISLQNTEEERTDLDASTRPLSPDSAYFIHGTDTTEPQVSVGGFNESRQLGESESELVPKTTEEDIDSGRVESWRSKNSADDPGKGLNSEKQSKKFVCKICYRVFDSGQGLGGHARSHNI